METYGPTDTLYMVHMPPMGTLLITLRKPYEFPMNFSVVTMDIFYSISMVTMDTLWFLWYPMDTLWYPMVPYGYPMIPYGTLWIPYGTLWYPMDTL